MNSSVRVAAVAVAGLLGAGVLLRPFAALDDQATAANGGPAGAGDLGPLLGRGVSTAALGGLRALAADGLWLRTYLAWSARDISRTQALIHLVTLVDDRPLGFWLNGARMLAYDVPRWRIGKLQAAGPVPDELCRRIMEEHAGLALQFLERGRRRHPASAEVCIEAANIHLNARRDVAAAADWYRQAARTPNAPYCAARIHAELLRRLGRPKDAYLWLRELYPTLPPGDEGAMREVILKRIRNLEDLLAIPEASRYAETANVGESG